MVETQLHRLLDAPGPLPPLRAVLLGGGPVRADLLERAQEAGLPCYTSYGLTEMSSQVVTQPPGGQARILPHREMQIAEDSEILVRGGTLCLGYLRKGRREPATAEDGWLHTHDLGRWEGGRLAILGRKDHQFISGGENIQPEAIETVLRDHPSIHEAVIVPCPDTDLGQRPAAFLSRTEAIDADALRSWLRERLSPHLIPVAFYALPAQGGMKVRRQELIEHLATEHELERIG